MSISLVKKSLELATGSTENRSISFKGHKKTHRKERQLKKKRPTDEKKNAAVVVQKIREKTLADCKINKVELNVERLLNLSRSNTIHKKLEEKLLEKIRTKKEDCGEVDEQKTGFTEEDFIHFEKEYFTNQ